WDGRTEQVPCTGYAILFARSIVARLPADLPTELSLAVMDVCGAPALTARVVREYLGSGPAPRVVVLGAAGKSGTLSLAAAREAGALTIGVVPNKGEASALRAAELADHVVIADARDALAVRAAVHGTGGPAQVTVVCVDVPRCEAGAILTTAEGGTVIFFSMATSFTAAALGAEGLAADVRLLIGNGYVPGHADYALALVRAHAGVRQLFEGRLA
ncbi:MAG: L-erythro-3,5-diaminohexanoate dehydrogenase, partial [Nocardioides sp.]